MIGTLVNTLLIIIGSLIGLLLSKRSNSVSTPSVIQIMGTFVLLIGLQSVKTADSGPKFIMMMMATLLGGVIGNVAQLEDRVKKVAQKLESLAHDKKSVPTEKRQRNLQAFVSSTLLYCVGPMAILGALQDGLKHDPSILISKGILDGVTSIALTASLGIGILFSAIPILIYQGGMTLLAQEIQVIMTQPVMDAISAVGGMLLIFNGLNLIGVTRISVLNLLPGIAIGAVAAYFCWV